MLSGNHYSVSGFQPIADSLPPDHLTWRLVAPFEPGFKIANAHPVFNLGFLDSYRDHGIGGDGTNPLAGPEDLKPLRYSIVKAFRRNANRVLDAFRVTADHFAAFDRHLSGDLAVSSFIRQRRADSSSFFQVKPGPSSGIPPTSSTRTDRSLHSRCAPRWLPLAPRCPRAPSASTLERAVDRWWSP